MVFLVVGAVDRPSLLLLRPVSCQAFPRLFFWVFLSTVMRSACLVWPRASVLGSPRVVVVALGVNIWGLSLVLLLPLGCVSPHIVSLGRRCVFHSW